MLCNIRNRVRFKAATKTLLLYHYSIASELWVCFKSISLQRVLQNAIQTMKESLKFQFDFENIFIRLDVTTRISLQTCNFHIFV